LELLAFGMVWNSWHLECLEFEVFRKFGSLGTLEHPQEPERARREPGENPGESRREPERARRESREEYDHYIILGITKIVRVFNISPNEHRYSNKKHGIPFQISLCSPGAQEAHPAG
jgi:hypothetical protein